MNCPTVFGFTLYPHPVRNAMPVRKLLPSCLSPLMGIPRTALTTPFPLVPSNSFLGKSVFAVADSELPLYGLASLEHRQDRR